jgi:hypothetical protein
MHMKGADHPVVVMKVSMHMKGADHPVVVMKSL